MQPPQPDQTFEAKFTHAGDPLAGVPDAPVGEWRVRLAGKGCSGHEGQTVTVRKQNGQDAEITLGACLVGNDERALYMIRRS